MRDGVRNAAFEKEIALAKELIARDELGASSSHLERAMSLAGARRAHARSHGLMLLFEASAKAPIAAVGQVVRLVLGILGSAVGKVPVGNTGGSDISMFKRMPIAPELQDIIDGRAPTDARG